MLQLNQSRSSSENKPAAAWGPIYYGWVMVAACFVVIALASPLISSFSIFQVAILGEFNWSRGGLAIALAIHLALGGLASPFAGHLIDRFGPRLAMPAGALITASALILMSQTGSLWHFYIAFGVIAAIGSSLLQIAPLTALISKWFARRRGAAIGILSAGSGAGQLALLPLIRFLINSIGWRYTYLALGIIVLIVPTVLTRLFLLTRPEDRRLPISSEGVEGQENERNPPEPRQLNVIPIDKEWAETDWNVSNASRTFRFWALTLVMALFAAGFFLISVQLAAYLEEKGYSPILAASVVGLQGMLNMVGKFVGGILCDRIGREKTLTLSIGVFVICILLLNLAGIVVSPMLVYTFTILYGIGFGMGTPALITSASDLYQGKHFGAILGVIVLGGYFGGAIGAWLSGHFFDITGAYQLNFIVSGLAMLTSAALIWKARPGGIRKLRGAKSS
jgi:MFS transporter, OFA family, oxalate/formate antiporter